MDQKECIFNIMFDIAKLLRCVLKNEWEFIWQRKVQEVCYFRHRNSRKKDMACTNDCFSLVGCVVGNGKAQTVREFRAKLRIRWAKRSRGSSLSGRNPHQTLKCK